MSKNSFVFFHGYHPDIWEGFVRRGFIGDTAGIRFCQSIMIDEKNKFNNLARKGSRLYETIVENSLPMYVDRLQGGSYIENYDYDMALVKDYREELGDKFFGFQMHEWMSNLRTDYKRLNGVTADKWTSENLEKAVRDSYALPYLFLEAATPDEYERYFPMPTDSGSFIATAQRLFKMRQDYTDGMLIPCDSYIMATNLELKLGARHVMPELGAQTPASNVQLAYARGMSRAYGRSFGAYYEPWGGEPFSACNYHKSSENEWNIGNSEDFPFETLGSEGGSSRSLQKRMMLYAYLSGASFMSEEWGLFNTFYDKIDFEISPYGAVKKDFLSFVDKYEAGEFYAPVAIVLPKDMLVLENICGGPEAIFGNQSHSCGAPEQVLLVHEGIRTLMYDSLSHFGNETESIINSDTPDAFDIIHEDCEAAFSNYKCLVNLTGSDALAKKHCNVVTAGEAKQTVYSFMPCTVSGGLHWFVNKINDGWYLTIFNNDGVDRSVARGDVFMPEATRTAEIDIGENSNITLLEGDGKIKESQGRYYIELKAGDTAFLKLFK